MKKLLLIIALVTLLPLQAHAIRIYACYGSTGNSTGDLDALDITGAGSPNANNLETGDIAWVINGDVEEKFVFNATSTLPGVWPATVRPNDYSSGGVWVNVLLLTFDMDNEQQKNVKYDLVYAGENLFDGGHLYIMWNDTNSRPEVYLYTGDTTDTDNDTYQVYGYAKADTSIGDPVVVDFGSICTAARRDGFSYINTDIGKQLLTAAGAGFQTTNAQAEVGDHNEMLGFFRAAEGSDAAVGFTSITGDYVRYNVVNQMVVVPSE